MKARTVVRRRGSHVLYTVGSQMAVRLSALRAGHPSPPRKVLGTQFCQKLSRIRSTAGRIRSIKKSDGLIRNRTRDPHSALTNYATSCPSVHRVYFLRSYDYNSKKPVFSWTLLTGWSLYRRPDVLPARYEFNFCILFSTSFYFSN
jgi:hypothetical protein